MTRAQLEAALAQLRAENAALRGQLARNAPVAAVPVTAPPATDAAAVPGPEQLQQLMVGMSSAVVFTDGSGQVIWANDSFMEMCGVTPAELADQPVAAFVRPDLVDSDTLKYIRDSLAAQIPFQYEVHKPHRSGEADWIRVQVVPIRNTAGVVTMLAGLVEDITEWKNSQFSLAEREVRFQALAENAPGVLYEWRKNHDGRFEFLYVSPKLQELFGIRIEDIVRMPEFIHPDDRPEFMESMAKAVAAQTPWNYEGRVVVNGQPLRWLRGRAVVTSIDEEGVEYSGILQDISQLKEAEAALRERDLRLRLAVEEFGDGAWERNLRTQQVTFSAQYRAMLGYKESNALSTYDDWRAHIHPDDAARVLEHTSGYLQGKQSRVTIEYRMRCQDGSYKWVLSRGMVTARDADNQPLILSGLISDISALKETKEALNISTHRLYTVIANFQEGLVLEDENRRIVLTNDAFCQLLTTTVTASQLVGKDGGELAEASKAYMKSPHRYMARITALMKRKKPVNGDIIHLLDGRIFQRDYTPIFDQQRHIGNLWKFQDITARTEAEAELRRSEEKYRGIIENMSLGLVEADLNDHLIYANQSFCDMTGYGTEDLAGRRFSPVLLSGADLEMVENKLRYRQHGVSDSYEVVVTTKSGERKWLLVSGAPLYNDHQRPVGSIGIYLDVTPQKHLEASLREAKAQAEISTRAKQDFLANMSHEIRTPMNAILGMSHLLAQTALNSTQTSYLNAITASATNLLVIINDILDLSKIDAGHMTIECIGFSPVQLFEQVERTLLYKAEEKGLMFSVQIGKGVPEVLLGDPYRLAQVLLNLAGNSIKFTAEGSVSVACSLIERLPDGEVLVEFAVGDTGIGMDASYLAHLFENFSQEDSSVSRKFGGTGLGLGISKKLVTLLGGDLHITSQKNWGTTSRFTLRLKQGSPADLPRQADSPDQSSLRYALRGKRVLLVEDNEFNRMLASVLLANIALEVTEAANGEIAVELAKVQAFDLILMDVQMPIMDGYEATAILRQHLSLTVPIIALTANAISGEREKCIAVGMNDYLTKPFQENALIRIVQEWVLGPTHPADVPVG
jgi:PAS domain S-box-containing protein